MKKTAKKPRFEVKETYYHRQGIEVLCMWIKDDPITFKVPGFTSIEKEQMFFSENDIIKFIPDVTVSNGFKDITLFEVVYKHALTGIKLLNMMDYFYRRKINVSVYEISALSILAQVKPPRSLKTIKAIKMI